MFWTKGERDEKAGRVVEGERRWGSGSLSTAAWLERQASSHQTPGKIKKKKEKKKETPDQLFTTFDLDLQATKRLD